MGLEDRDWYREEQRKRLNSMEFFQKSSAPTNWFVVILFWFVLLFVLFQIWKHYQRPARTSPFSSTAPNAVPAPTPVSPVIPRSQERRQQSQIYPAEAAQAQELPRPMVQSTPPGVVTIYRCKAYSGGIFWSSDYCGNQQALIDRTATVPNGMPFEQQVQIAEAQRIEAMALYNQQPSPEVQRADRCGALKRERETIESRYTNWQWQPLEVINPDQTRMKGLRAEQARLGCPTQ